MTHALSPLALEAEARVSESYAIKTRPLVAGTWALVGTKDAVRPLLVWYSSESAGKSSLVFDVSDAAGQ